MNEEGIVRMLKARLKQERRRKVGPRPGYSNEVRKTPSLTPIATGSKINSHSTTAKLPLVILRNLRLLASDCPASCDPSLRKVLDHINFAVRRCVVRSYVVVIC